MSSSLWSISAAEVASLTQDLVRLDTTNPPGNEQAAAELLESRLLAAGYVEEPELERADVAILNTCVVRQASEDKVYSKLHELRAWKTPDRTLALTGCLVRKEGETLRRRFPQLDRVVPIGEYDEFVADLGARYDLSLGEPMPVAGRCFSPRSISQYQSSESSGCNPPTM